MYVSKKIDFLNLEDTENEQKICDVLADFLLNEKGYHGVSCDNFSCEAMSAFYRCNTIMGCVYKLRNLVWYYITDDDKIAREIADDVYMILDAYMPNYEDAKAQYKKLWG
jgi:uncharacterized protein (UPF0297 family)